MRRETISRSFFPVPVCVSKRSWTIAIQLRELSSGAVSREAREELMVSAGPPSRGNHGAVIRDRVLQGQRRISVERPIRMEVLSVRSNPIRGDLTLSGGKIDIPTTHQVVKTIFQSVFDASVPNSG